MTISRRVKLSAYLSRDIMHKLQIISTIDKWFFGNKTTASSIIEKALVEYFENHKDEIGKMMDEYHEKGGCFRL